MVTYTRDTVLWLINPIYEFLAPLDIVQDTSFDYIVNPKKENWELFIGSMDNNTKTCLLNSKGETIIPLAGGSIEYLPEVKLFFSQQFGLYNLDGTVVQGGVCEYRYLMNEEFKGRYLIQKADGLYNLDGQMLYPGMYKTIDYTFDSDNNMIRFLAKMSSNKNEIYVLTSDGKLRTQKEFESTRY